MRGFEFLIFLSFLAALSAATVIRNSFWESGVALWSDAASKSAGKARPHANLGMAYDILGDMEMAKAKEEYQRAISLEPDYLAPYGPLAVIYGKKGDIDGAIEILSPLTRRYPLDFKAHTALGVAYMLKGRLEEAEDEFNLALRIKPDYEIARRNMEELRKKTHIPGPILPGQKADGS